MTLSHSDLYRIQFDWQLTSKERVEARKILDAERVRLYDIDRRTGSSLLLKWTREITEGFEMADIEIDDGVTMPAEVVEKPKRGRKPGTKNAPSQGANLLAALDFVAFVKSETYEFSDYVSLHNHVAVAYNNVVAAGHPIQEELTKAVHLDKLRAALNKCGKTLTITESDVSLSVKGDKLRASVPLLAEALAVMAPDPCMIVGEFDGLKEAFRVAGTVSKEDGERVFEASLLLEPNTVTGTNGFAMLQYWHGFANMPPGTVIPKTFAAAVAASKLKIAGIGANWDNDKGFATSLTFWFEGGAWMKTQCYEERWPDLSNVLGFPTENTIPVPADMFEGLNAVTPFTGEETNAVYFVDGAIQTDPNPEVGARYEVKGLPAGKVFNSKLVKQVSGYCKTIDLTTNATKALFFGGTDANPVRGALMGMSGSK